MNYLSSCIRRAVPRVIKFPTLEQDGQNSQVASVVRFRQDRLLKKARKFEHWQRPRVPLKGHSDKQVQCTVRFAHLVSSRGVQTVHPEQFSHNLI